MEAPEGRDQLPAIRSVRRPLAHPVPPREHAPVRAGAGAGDRRLGVDRDWRDPPVPAAGSRVRPPRCPRRGHFRRAGHPLRDVPAVFRAGLPAPLRHGGLGLREPAAMGCVGRTHAMGAAAAGRMATAAAPRALAANRRGRRLHGGRRFHGVVGAGVPERVRVRAPAHRREPLDLREHPGRVAHHHRTLGRLHPVRAPRLRLRVPVRRNDALRHRLPPEGARPRLWAQRAGAGLRGAGGCELRRDHLQSRARVRAPPRTRIPGHHPLLPAARIRGAWVRPGRALRGPPVVPRPPVRRLRRRGIVHGVRPPRGLDLQEIGPFQRRQGGSAAERRSPRARG